MLAALAKLKNDNKKGEYYLTDIYGILRKGGKRVTAVQAVTQEDVIGVNTRQQLAEVDAIMQERIQRKLRESGVTIVSGFNTYVEDGASIGQDTVIQPFTFIGRGATIGADCVIGPFASVTSDSIVPEGTTLAGSPTTSGSSTATSIRNRRRRRSCRRSTPSPARTTSGSTFRNRGRRRSVGCSYLLWLRVAVVAVIDCTPIN